MICDEGGDVHRDHNDDGGVEKVEEPIKVLVPAKVWVNGTNDPLTEHGIDGEEHDRTVCSVSSVDEPSLAGANLAGKITHPALTKISEVIATCTLLGLVAQTILMIHVQVLARQKSKVNPERWNLCPRLLFIW